MKKIIASASVAALGAASLQAAYAPGLSPVEKSKPWTISASLRGFYDDNYLTQSKANERDSFGIELSPSLAVNLALDQTLIGFSYTYSLRWYEDRSNNSADHSHQVKFKLNHAFNERFKLDVSDNFLMAQEPQVNDSSPALTTLRNDGDYLNNVARVGLRAELTPIFGLDVSYQNTIWDFDQEGPGSRSAILDRMEHLGNINGRWQAAQNTAGLFGYMYGAVGFSSDESLAQNAPFVAGTQTDPASRDSTSHTIYLGVDQIFTSQLNASLRVGAEFTDYPDAVGGMDDSATSPYVDGSATWTYNPGSFLRLGLRVDRNATDVAFQNTPDPTQDQLSTSAYATINHRITPKLTGSLLGHFQHSTFNGGAADGSADNFFLAGLNLSYQINAFLSTEAGYNYDRLDSDLVNRSFTRNRVYIGVRATY
jgi:putative beta-barrel porin BBP2